MRLTTSVAGISTTSRCTLSCKLCGAGIIPLREKKHLYNAQISEIQSSIDALFDIYEYIEHLDFTGGEPLLWDSGHGKITQCLNYLKNYKNRFGFIRILTNGTIIPPNELITSIKSLDYKFEFLLDNYGSVSFKAEETKSLLIKNNINFRENIYYGDEQFFDGWVDILGDLSYRNYSKEELSQVFKTCEVSKRMCNIVSSGKLYPCPTMIVTEAIYGITDDCVIPLLTKDILIENQIEAIKKFGEKIPEACNYCNGFDTVNAKRFPAGEQV